MNAAIQTKLRSFLFTALALGCTASVLSGTVMTLTLA